VRQGLKLSISTVFLWLLAACETGMQSSPNPAPRPEIAETTPRSELSQYYVNYYARLQEDFLVQGLLRTDGGGVDVPFDADDLTENFMKIAFYAEFSEVNGRIIARERAHPMRRWRAPIVINVEFGETLSKEQQKTDQLEVASFAKRLQEATGHPVRTGSASTANLHVLILNEDERRAATPKLRRLIPGIAPQESAALTNITKNDLCIAQSYSEGGASKHIGRALVIIRDEHPDLLRQSCIHEEIAQSLGLPNDSDAARPSIFNDDEEFGLLTTHDEYLLRILYDPRLTPEMDAAIARPIVRAIAGELLTKHAPDHMENT
jgi:hypothetical protein